VRYLPLLLLTACLSPPPGLVIVGATPAQDAQARGLLAAAVTVTGDVSGYLSGDLTVSVVQTRSQVREWCMLGGDVVGCNYPSRDRFIVIILSTPDLASWNGLSHEFCHLGLGTYVEADADTCGRTVLREYAR
jgi:hypothetical protein